MRNVAFAIASLFFLQLAGTASPAAAETVILPGSVTCILAGGVVKFSPPLSSRSRQFTTSETIEVTAFLKPCAPSDPNVPAGVKGTLTGRATFSTPGSPSANDCDAIFPSSGTRTFSPSPPVWRTGWSVDNEASQIVNTHELHLDVAPTYLSFTIMEVTNSGGTISLAIEATPTDSFSSPASAKLDLRGLMSSSSYTMIKVACATTRGLSTIFLGSGDVESL